MSHLLTAERYDHYVDFTFSDLLVESDKFGKGVEDEYRLRKVNGETRIPDGVYPLGMRYSPNFSKYFLWSESTKMLIDARDIGKPEYRQIHDFNPHELIWIKNIPNFDLVLIHWGNTDLDSKGCYIVGKEIGKLMVTVGGKKQSRMGVLQSRIMYKQLYTRVMPLIREGGHTMEFRSINFDPNNLKIAA